MPSMVARTRGRKGGWVARNIGGSSCTNSYHERVNNGANNLYCPESADLSVFVGTSVAERICDMVDVMGACVDLGNAGKPQLHYLNKIQVTLYQGALTTSIFFLEQSTWS